MSQAPAPAKICVLCGQDCSKRPRTKDQQGRYTCDECLTRAKAARPAAVAPAAPPPPIVEDDGPLAIVEDDTPPMRPSMPCPTCARPLAADVMICVGCGFNRATGEKLGTSTSGKAPPVKKGPKKFACAECGYDLTGLKTTRCPECGKVNTIRSSKRERDIEESKRIARMAYIKPAIMLAAGLGLATIILASQAGSMVIPIYLLKFAIGFVISLVVYFVCSLIFIGFDEPFHLMTLRLAGVYAVMEAITLIVEQLPLGIGVPILLGAIWIGLMVTVMEIDKEDAIIYGVLSFVVKIAVGIFVLSML
jgi:hypothetical protein